MSNTEGLFGSLMIKAGLAVPDSVPPVAKTEEGLPIPKNTPMPPVVGYVPPALPFDCPPHRSFVRGYNTLGFLSVEEVIPLIGIEERHVFKVNGQEVDIKLSSSRLLPFRKSLKCYNPYCNEEGFIFAIQQSSRHVQKGGEFGGWHINLYSHSGRLMTCDHLIPKSSFPKGQSPNGAENLDTLCTVCNSKKFTDSVEVFLEKQKLASLFIQHQKQQTERFPEDFEGQTVSDIIKILKKFPPTMRIARDKVGDGNGFGVPAILSFRAGPYSRWDRDRRPNPQTRVFFGWKEL